MRILLALVLALADPSATTPHGDQSAVESRVRSTIAALEAGTLDRKTLTPAFSQLLTTTTARDLGQSLAGYGVPSTLTLVDRRSLDGVTTYVFVAAFGATTATVTIGIDDASDLIATFYVRGGQAI